MMKIIALLGSRNPEGQTARITNALIQAFKNDAGQTEQIFLPGITIERCRQCGENGWGICKTEGKCVIEDNFAATVDIIRSADGIIIATPVYFGDLSESMRAFLDRLRRVCINQNGKTGISGKPTIGICLAGGGGSGAPGCLVSLERALALCGLDVMDMIPARKQNIELKLDTLRITGSWFMKKLQDGQK
jgi:multimeric flavodoxin WrbA